MSALAVDEARTTRALIEERLEDFFARRTTMAAAHGGQLRRLWELAAQCAFGGKLVRPMLLVDTHDALLASPFVSRRDAVIDLAVAVELLHFAFLLHDDIIDGDLQRRGQPNLIAALRGEAPPGISGEEAAHWATSGALLMGDLVLAGMHHLTGRLEIPVAQRTRILDLFDATITETVAGELSDVALCDSVLPGGLDGVLTMTMQKTAAYTFELPLRAGSILADASPALEEELAAVGRHLGLAFQLQDDLLSTFGVAREHGKDRYSDIREGKQTALIAFARHTDAWTRLEPIIGDPALSPAQGALAAHLLADCGARAFVEGLVNDRFAAVDAAADGFPGPVAELVRGRARQLKARRS